MILGATSWRGRFYTEWDQRIETNNVVFHLHLVSGDLVSNLVEKRIPRIWLTKQLTKLLDKYLELTDPRCLVSFGSDWCAGGSELVLDGCAARTLCRGRRSSACQNMGLTFDFSSGEGSGRWKQPYAVLRGKLCFSALVLLAYGYLLVLLLVLLLPLGCCHFPICSPPFGTNVGECHNRTAVFSVFHNRLSFHPSMVVLWDRCPFVFIFLRPRLFAVFIFRSFAKMILVCQIQEMVKYLNGVVELLEAHFLGSWTSSAHQGSKRESPPLSFLQK